MFFRVGPDSIIYSYAVFSKHNGWTTDILQQVVLVGGWDGWIDLAKVLQHI